METLTKTPEKPAEHTGPTYEKGEIKMLDKYARELAEKMLKDTAGKPNTKVLFDGSYASKIEFHSGSWGLIYKGDTPVRMVQFTWQQDIETRQSWAVFRARDFYNQKPPILIWKRLRIPVIIVPFDKSKYSCDYYAQGYLAKFSEESLRQLSVHKNENEVEVAEGMKDLRMVSQNLALYRMLSKYLSSKWNWTWIIIILAIAIIGGFTAFELHAHPQWIASLTHALNLGSIKT